MSQDSTADGAHQPPTLEAFMAQALQMELDAAERYNEFADMMETHNNLEVAQWFRKMAEVEGKHADKIMSEMGWSEAPSALRTAPLMTGLEAPESASDAELHYLMQPWHVLQLALANEQRAERFFAKLASLATVESVRKAALELQQVGVGKHRQFMPFFYSLSTIHHSHHALQPPATRPRRSCACPRRSDARRRGAGPAYPAPRP